MVQIGELAYKTRFDGRELSRGLLSTRQQMAAAKKIAEESRTPLDRYKTGMENLAAMSQRYSHVAAKQADLSKTLEKQYLQEESAVRKLTKAEKARLELLQLPDAIKARAAAPDQSRERAREANRQAGLARQAMFQGIDQQQTAGRSALQQRLARFKQGKQTAASDAIANINNSRALAGYGMSGVGSGFHSAGQRGDAPGGDGGGGIGAFAFGAKAFAGGFAVAKVVQTTNAMREFAKESQSAYAQVERTRVALTQLAGGSAAADGLIRSMKTLTIESGLSSEALNKAASTLMGYGVSTEETKQQMRELAAITNGDTEKFLGLSRAIAQVQSKGRLMAEELNQMTEFGFNPLQEIARTTGKDMDQLRQMMERGQLSASLLTDALTSLTSEGGKYFGMLEAGSQTTDRFQKVSEAAWRQAREDVGQALAPLTKWSSWVSTEFAKSVSEVAGTLKDLSAAGQAVPEPPAAPAKSAAVQRLEEERARVAAENKRIADNREATKKSAMASLAESETDAMLGSVQDDPNFKAFSRALAVMDEHNRKLAVEDFAQTRSLDNTYSYVDEEVKKELEKLDALEKQNAAIEEQKKKNEEMKAEGEAMKESQKTVAERLMERANRVQELFGAGAIDSVTAMREQSAIEKEMQASINEQRSRVSSTAATMTSGSEEAARYLQQLAGEQAKAELKIDGMDKLTGVGEKQLTELQNMTKQLEKMTKTSPRKV